jgi:hypothetical protein
MLSTPRCLSRCPTSRTTFCAACSTSWLKSRQALLSSVRAPASSDEQIPCVCKAWRDLVYEPEFWQSLTKWGRFTPAVASIIARSNAALRTCIARSKGMLKHLHDDKLCVGPSEILDALRGCGGYEGKLLSLRMAEVEIQPDGSSLAAWESSESVARWHMIQVTRSFVRAGPGGTMGQLTPVPTDECSCCSRQVHEAGLRVTRRATPRCARRGNC